MTLQAPFVVVGGGIAGVSCVEGLAFLAPEEHVILVTPSPTVKTVANLRNMTKLLSEFYVQEKSASYLTAAFPNVRVIEDSVVKLDGDNHTIQIKSGTVVEYEKLCLCTGASPKLIANNPLVLGIRDTDSVQKFQKKVASSRKVAVVGNGGIATELVYDLVGIEVVWVVKDDHISAPFLDAGAAVFFQNKMKNRGKTDGPQECKRLKYTVDRGSSQGVGPSLGPDWHTNVNLRGTSSHDNISIEYNCEVNRIDEGDSNWPVYLELTNGKRIGCDFIVSATGVHPNTQPFNYENGFELADDGGFKVNWKMETSIPDIFAAGDACTADWHPTAPHWFQMRLWTQAKQMGTYAAKAMACALRGEELIQDFCFETFTHVTRFFGTKVILLGLYNGQTLLTDDDDDAKYEALVRVTDGVEYVKLVMVNGRMQGALLVGDTDLEEMCENLILNQLDLTDFGEELLNPDIDIDDYFD